MARYLKCPPDQILHGMTWANLMLYMAAANSSDQREPSKKGGLPDGVLVTKDNIHHLFPEDFND